MQTETQSRRADELAYVLPMAAFLALLAVGGHWPRLYPASYAARTLIAAVLLAAGWRHYTKITWRSWWFGALVGAAVLVQWVGMEKVLPYPHLPAGSVFNPMTDIAGTWTRWGFIAVRWAGASLVVPVMEELFWRDYLWRTIAAPNDFKLAAVGEWDLKAYIVVSLLFASVHTAWLTALVCGLIYGALLVRTRSLGACIIAHGVTNFLLGAYVLKTGQWFFW